MNISPKIVENFRLVADPPPPPQWPVPHVQIPQSASGVASSTYCTSQQRGYIKEHVHCKCTCDAYEYTHVEHARSCTCICNVISQYIIKLKRFSTIKGRMKCADLVAVVLWTRNRCGSLGSLLLPLTRYLAHLPQMRSIVAGRGSGALQLQTSAPPIPWG